MQFAISKVPSAKTFNQISNRRKAGNRCPLFIHFCFIQEGKHDGGHIRKYLLLYTYLDWTKVFP